MKKKYQITRDALRKKDFKAGIVVKQSPSKKVDNADVFAPVLADLLMKK